MKKLFSLLIFLTCVALPFCASAQPEKELMQGVDDDLKKFDEAEADLIVQRMLTDEEADETKTTDALQTENEQVIRMHDLAYAEQQTLEASIETLRGQEANLTDEAEELQKKNAEVVSDNRRLFEEADEIGDGDELVTSDQEARYQAATGAIEQNERIVNNNEQSIIQDEAVVSASQQLIEDYEEQIEKLKELIEHCDSVVAANIALIKMKQGK